MQQYLKSNIICFLFFLLCFSVQPLLASDAYVKVDDNEVGQGIMRQRGSDCLIVAPAHVVENALIIEITTADRVKHQAEILELFPGDISVVRFKGDDAVACRNAVWSDATNLNVLLEVEKQGELRTMLGDGSIRITPVDIVAYDKYRNINVRPKNRTDAISKGESGSPLYIAGKLAGMLLFVKNDIGNVLRQDALANTLSLFFGDTNQVGRVSAKPSDRENTPQTYFQEKVSSNEQVFNGVIVQSAVAEHLIKLEENSPVRLNFSATGGQGRYSVEIMDSTRRVLYRGAFKRYGGVETVTVPFTAPKNDTYLLHITGTEGEVAYSIKMAAIVSDAQLRGSGNVMHVGGNAVTGIIAQGAAAVYRIKLEANSPVRLVSSATGDQGKYKIEILDSTGRTVYQASSRQYGGTDTAMFPFTATKNDTYTIHIIGTQSEGKYAVKILPIASDAQLRGEANVIQVGGAVVEGVIAQGAVAEYRIKLEAKSPVRLVFSATGEQGKYNVEILDSTGKTVYRDPHNHLSGKEAAHIPFNVSKSDTYSLRIIGTEGEGRYSLNIIRAN
jgi:hypothetical protein